MGSNKNLIGSILIALAAFVVWGWGVPAYDQIGALRVAIKERQEVLNKKQAILDNIKKINLEYQKRLGDVKKLSSIVPAKKGVAEVVSSLESLSTKNGLQMTGANITDQKSSDSSILFDALNIDINLTGSYLSLLSFLGELEKNIRLIDVVNIDTSQTGNQQGLNFRIRANAYYLK